MKYVVSAGWELTINAFPPGQVLKEYCREEAMGMKAKAKLKGP
jgi:hypothetical protein